MMRFIVAGCGRLVTQVHLPNLARMEGSEVVALVDPSEESLASARVHAPNAESFPTLVEALECVSSDAVLIGTPNGLHVSMTLAALEAGRFVYLEKPIATDRAEALRLTAHPNAKRRVMVGFNYRFHPLVREMRRRLRGGEFGNAVSMRTIFSTAESNPPSWKTKRGTGGGALLDLASHDVDLLRFVTGREIAAVTASIHSRHSEDDTVSLLLELEGGGMAQCVAMSGCAETAGMEIIGDRGGAAFERYRSDRLETIGLTVGGLGEKVKGAIANAAALPHRLKRLRHPWNEPSFAASLDAFVQAVRAGKAIRPGVADGMKALDVLLAAEESATSGTRIRMDR